MKKLAIALAALAGITLLSGCTYDYHPYYFGHYAYGSYGPLVGYSIGGLGWDCVHHWNVTYCRA